MMMFPSHSRSKWRLGLTGMLVLCSLVVAMVVAPSRGFAATSASDNFNRANGSLGSAWTNLTDGGLTISNQMVVGTNAGGNSGNVRTAETYGNDQYSQVTVTATALTGTQWIGPMVRTQNSGAKLYVGIYFWNNGGPELMLFKRINGTWTQLGSTYSTGGALAAGTTLTLTAVGTTLTFAQNGVTRITATDSSVTSGAPGIMANGTASADNWAGGTVGASYSVGGIVSGLTGSVVLQDNAGDNLTVNANGTFTFATPLASGAAYNVTVATNPTGQTCTVANGTGTIGTANVTNVAVTCTTQSTGGGGGGGGSTGSASDDFNRANGPLGPNWTDTSDGGLAISNQMVVGTNAGGNSADIRTAETYSNDQYSQVMVTSTALTGSQWIGPMVRAQNGGAGLYVGIYFWNNGGPNLMLFKRLNGTWTQLGSTYSTGGALAAGTTLTLTAAGTTLTFAQNGVTRITATDTSLTSGAPGIMANGAATADNWAGGNGASGSAPSTYSVGGTVSGLTGSVVLQDNAGDNLTVSANGTFTFATPLASGAAYNVTVASNPTGQTCTVANGSGTIGTANVSNVAITCTTQSSGGGGGGGSTGSASDDFNRANGPLGPNWTDMTDGGLAISNQAVVGTNAGGNSGDIRTAETYTSDQYSQVTVTGTALTGTQWIGPAVRAQSGGQNLYVGIYFWNNGDPELMLFKRLGGAWTELGSDYSTGGALAAGTTLSLTVLGSTLTFAQNGVTRVTASDTSIVSGAPGIMANGAATADNWTGGSEVGTYSVGGTVSGLTGSVVLQDNSGDNLTVSANGTFTFATLLAPGATYNVSVATNPAGQTCTVANGLGTVTANVTNVAVTCVAGTVTFQVTYQSTDATGIASYSVLSADNGYGTQTLRVLKPTHPAAGVAHNFLYVLPVEPGLGNSFGDGLATLQALDDQDKYNLTIVEPTFTNMPWYANSSTDPAMQYETFMTNDLAPWVKANLATTGTEQNWLIGFSKSGVGGQDLILRHPDVFALAATWDFPADISSYDQYDGSAMNYGTQANFAANYQLTASFLAAHKTPFLTKNRIWIGGYSLFQQDVSDYNSLLTAQGISHTNGASKNLAHRWDSGWVAGAMAALYQDSLH